MWKLNPRMSAFLRILQICSAVYSEGPDGHMQASHCLSFSDPAADWYQNTLIYNSPHCANSHSNSKKRSSFSSFFLYLLLETVKAVVSRLVSCLIKDSICSHLLDICLCFEASLCLRVPPLQTDAGRGLWAGLSCPAAPDAGAEAAQWKSINTQGGFCSWSVGWRRKSPTRCCCWREQPALWENNYF